MGESSTAANVLAVLSALEQTLPRFGFPVEPGSGVAAAERVFAAR
jgi:aspartate aminotransferase-like enzyme